MTQTLSIYMNASKSFSFSRVGWLLKRDFAENWKYNLNVILAMSLAFLLPYLYNMEMHNAPWFGFDDGSLESYINGYTVGFVMIISFALDYFASQIMRNMRTKEQRLSYLMLPATSLEKFVSRALYVTLGIFMMLLLASLLSEVVHYLLVPLFELPEHKQVCIWPRVWMDIFSDINPLVLMHTLFTHSLYILGGSYFRKHPFIKTCGLMLLVNIVIGYIAIQTYHPELIERNGSWLHVHKEAVSWGVKIFTLCWVALNWWLSYKLFTRQQVVKN